MSLDEKDKNVCEVADEFKKQSARALKCSLKGIELTSKSGIVDFIYQALADNVLVRFVGFHHQDAYYYVDVAIERETTDGDVTLVKLNDYLIENQYAKALETEIVAKAPSKNLVY